MTPGAGAVCVYRPELGMYPGNGYAPWSESPWACPARFDPMPARAPTSSAAALM